MGEGLRGDFGGLKASVLGYLHRGREGPRDSSSEQKKYFGGAELEKPGPFIQWSGVDVANWLADPLQSN